MASVVPVNNYDAKTSLPAKRRSRNDITEFSNGVNVVTLELLLFVLKEEGVEYSSSSSKYSTSKCDELAKALEALKTMSGTMLKDYGSEMRPLCSTLDLSDEQFYSTYCLVAENSLGYPDISVGRIVSLMTFTGLLASHLIQLGQECKVESLLGWERTFIHNKCQAYIEGHGGWKSIRVPHKESNLETRSNGTIWLAPVVLGLGIAAALGAFYTR
ncbi:hypothetical protein EMCRGX_G000705 [Ephydatia muelleri]